MNDLIPGVKIQGQVDFHGKNIYDAGVDATLAAQAHRHGVSEGQPLPHEHL